MNLSESKLRKIIRQELVSKSKINEGWMDWATEGMQLVKAMGEAIPATSTVSAPEMMAVLSTMDRSQIESAWSRGGPSEVDIDIDVEDQADPITESRAPTLLRSTLRNIIIEEVDILRGEG